MSAGDRSSRIIGVLLGALLVSPALPTPFRAATAPSRSTGLPQAFEANRGQTDSNVMFLSRADGFVLTIDATGIGLDLASADPAASPAVGERSGRARLVFRGMQPSVEVQGIEPLKGRVAYLGGADRKTWIEDVPSFAAVRYVGLYTGINLVLRGDHRRLILDFDLAAEADRRVIDLALEGDDDGVLRLSRSDRGRSVRVTLEVGRTAGTTDGVARVVVDRDGNTFLAGRTPPGDLPAEAFVARIDRGETTPTFVTYFGGSGRDVPLALAVAPDGTIVVAGRTESPDFPGAGVPLRGPADGFVLRLARDGSVPVKSILVGGDGDDEARALALDAHGDVFVGGNGFLLAPEGMRLVPPGLPTGMAVEALLFDETGRLVFAGSRQEGDRLQPFVGGADGGTVAIPVSGEAAATALALDDAGTLYVTGRRVAGEPGFVAVLDAATWTTSALRDIDGVPLAIAAGGEGHAWIVGTRGPIDDRRSFIARVSGADATLDRFRSIPPDSMSRVTGIALDPDGRPVVAGFEDRTVAAGKESAGKSVEEVPPARMIAAAAPAGLIAVRPLAESTIGPGAAGCPGTIRFDNGAGTGVWQTAANWSTDVLPGPADDVCIPAGSIVTLGAGTHTISTLFVETGGALTMGGAGAPTLNLGAASQVDGTLTVSSSATLGGAADIAVAGLLTWTSGTISGAGTLFANGGAAISGFAVKNITSNRILRTSGTVTWAGTGSIRMFQGGRIYNDGIWDAQSDAAIIVDVFGGFENPVGKVFKKTAGTGATTMGGFTNDGSLSIESGTVSLITGSGHGSYTGLAGTTLQFAGSPNNLYSSTVNVPTVRLTSGSAAINGPYTASSETILDNGALYIDPGATVTAIGTAVTISADSQNPGAGMNLNSGEAITPTTLTLNGGALVGSDTVSVSGAMIWNRGSMGGGGVVNANGGLAIGGAGFKDLSNGVLNTSGVTTWNGTGAIRMASGSVIRNGGSWDVQTDADMLASLGGAGRFDNLADGTFQRTAGADVSILSVDVTNAGIIRLQAGATSLTGSYNQTAGLLSVEAGSLSSNGTLQIDGGTLGGFGTITGNVGLRGHLSPGTSLGSLSIVGRLDLGPGAAFDVEVGGLTPGTEHDHAAVSGAVTLAGTLNVTLVNGFVPAELDTFTILAFPSATGAFSTINAPILPGNLVWQVLTEPDAVVLEVITDCAPLDADVWSVPAEVSGVAFGTNNQTISWTSLGLQAGPATTYDLMRGLISQLPAGGGPAETCLAQDIGSTQFEESATPESGAGFYYLVRGSNACGVGTYGASSGGVPRHAPVCP
jgi:hypothetical protein